MSQVHFKMHVNLCDKGSMAVYADLDDISQLFSIHCFLKALQHPQLDRQLLAGAAAAAADGGGSPGERLLLREAARVSLPCQQMVGPCQW